MYQPNENRYNNMKEILFESVISTKAGFDMWPGPYGDFGSDGIMLESSKGQSYFCPDRSKSKETDCRQYKE